MAEPPRKRARGKSSPAAGDGNRRISDAAKPEDAAAATAATAAVSDATSAATPVRERDAAVAAASSADRPNAAAAAVNSAKGSKTASSLPFLRLANGCNPAVPAGATLKPLVYLDKTEVNVGRLPSCDVVLDSTRWPQMISRVHAKLKRIDEAGGGCKWILVDKSMNGVLVNDTKVPQGEEGHLLQPLDTITFGRKVTPPEFEYVFEGPSGDAEKEKEKEEQQAALAEELADQMEKISKLEEELESERKTRTELSQQKRLKSGNLEVSDLHQELTCSICQDWQVHPATIECSHCFCWCCIDHWLLQKTFECPVCRNGVTREPVRNMALDNLIQKAVDRLAEEERKEYAERLTLAQTTAKKNKKLHAELEKSVNDALQKGKNFFQIGSSWSKKEVGTFQRGIKEYKGNTRETYCKLTGLTVQWVHSADSTKLNRALHNLQLQKFVDKSDDDIRQRLLMFLRYG